MGCCSRSDLVSLTDDPLKTPRSRVNIFDTAIKQTLLVCGLSSEDEPTDDMEQSGINAVQQQNTLSSS